MIKYRYLTKGVCLFKTVWYMEQQEMEISLSDIINIVKKNILLEIVIGLLFLIAGVVYTYVLVEPTYESSATIFVSKASKDENDFDYSTANNLMESIVDMVKEEIILKGISDKYNIKSEKLKENLHVTSSKNSYFIKIAYEGTDKYKTADIANDVVDKLVEVSNSGVIEALQNSISITTYATVGEYASPNKVLYLVLSVVIGGVVACAVVFVKELTDKKFKTHEEVEKYLNVNVLGTLTESKDKNVSEEEFKIAALPYRINQLDKIFGNIKYSNIDRKLKVIQFSSTIMSEFKSTTLSNIAVRANSTGESKVLIIDLDLRRPSIHKIFGISRAMGVSEMLQEKDTNVKDYIKQTTHNVDVITSGSKVENPMPLLDSLKLKSIIRDLRDEYDYIFVDGPPTTVAADSVIISSLADATIYNVSCNLVEKHQAVEGIKSLTKAGANIIGYVVSREKESKENNYYYYEEESTN